MREEFGKVHNYIDTFSTEIQVLKENIAVLKEDITVLKEDVVVLKDDSTENKVNFLRMQGRMDNSLIYNPFLRITLIPIYRSETGLTLPTKFPKTVHKF